MKKPWPKRLLLGLLVVFIMLAVWIGLGIRSTLKSLPEAYAIWGTGELVIAHLDKTGELPKSWNDLDPLWDEGCGAHARPGGIESIEQLENMVEIRFDRLDEHRISAVNGVAPKKLITSRSGETARWSGADADEMIVEHLAKIAETNN